MSNMELITMAESRIKPFIEYSIKEYAQAMVLSQEYKNDKIPQKLSRQEVMSYFINGKLLPNENLMNITVDGEIVGNLWVSLSKREGQTRAFLTWIDISPDYRRKGYAKEALELMEKRLRDISAHYFELSVFAHNTGAQKLYLDLGFTITRERRFGHSQKPSRITMTKYLIANALFNS